MRVVKATANVYFLAMGAALIVLNANAQSPAPASPSDTNWCPGVPATPPPPHWENLPGAWTHTYKACSADRSTLSPRDRHNRDVQCRNACMGARGSWSTSKNPPSKNPYPLSTDKLQGPFPLPGGGSGYVLPVPSSVLSPTIPAQPPAPAGSNFLGGAIFYQ